MESTLFVGLDAHKNSIVATVVDQEGTQLDQTRLGSGDTELQEYLDGLSGRIEVVVEATQFTARCSNGIQGRRTPEGALPYGQDGTNEEVLLAVRQGVPP